MRVLIVQEGQQFVSVKHQRASVQHLSVAGLGLAMCACLAAWFCWSLRREADQSCVSQLCMTGQDWSCYPLHKLLASVLSTLSLLSLPLLQSRRLDIRVRTPKMQGGEQKNLFVHMLNSTLTATERTLCCVLENYQTPDGVRVPEILQPFLPGIDFIPFRKVYDAKGKLIDRPKPAAVADGSAA